MRWRHGLLVALFALLQGMAPLLHAHLGGDRGGATGVHLHGAIAPGHGVDVVLDVSQVAPDESLAIGVGQELRRKWSWSMPDLAPLPAVPVAALAPKTVDGMVPERPATVHPASPRLTPPSQAPPPRG